LLTATPGIIDTTRPAHSMDRDKLILDAVAAVLILLIAAVLLAIAKG
jgi:hypothetical protein